MTFSTLLKRAAIACLVFLLGWLLLWATLAVRSAREDAGVHAFHRLVATVPCATTLGPDGKQVPREAFFGPAQVASWLPFQMNFEMHQAMVPLDCQVALQAAISGNDYGFSLNFVQ